MATTTCTLTLSSDMLSSPINISASTTITKADLTTGLELIEMGRGTIAETDGSKTAEFGLPTALGNDKAAKCFFVNKATDPTFYIDIDIHDTNIGRLYAGDWMFIPWEQAAATQDIGVEAISAAQVVEVVCIHQDETLTAS